MLPPADRIQFGGLGELFVARAHGNRVFKLDQSAPVILRRAGATT